MYKICCKCKLKKPLSLFSKDNSKKDGRRYSCKECDKIRMKAYDSSKEGKARMRRGRWFQQNIKITNEEYEYKYAKQKGKCYICKESFDSLCVDHNHDTGKVRGLLCKKCNLGLGNFKDSLELLKNAIDYLKEYEDGQENNLSK